MARLPEIFVQYPPIDSFPIPLSLSKGDTGSGKSSILNAVLGEVTILPTNGMRACTAAIIELAANDIINPTSGSGSGPDPPPSPAVSFHRSCPQYCGMVEFLSADDWAEELDGMYASLTSEEGQLQTDRPQDKDSAASLAWWKLKSVFGRVASREELEMVEGAGGPPESVEDVCSWCA